MKRYVNNNLLTIQHKLVQINVSRIALAFKKLEQWIYNNGMIFDLAEFETINFF